MHLRPERTGDRHGVRDLHLAAFGGHGVAVAELAAGLHPTVTADSGLSLVADDDGEVVGQAMFSGGLLDAPRRLVDVQVLSPVAVRPERQRQGIGSALIRHGLETMSARGVPVVFVEGAPGYYSRLGFRSGAEQGFRKPSLRIPDAAFQAIRLPAYRSWMSGTLVYAEIFWRLDAVGLRDPDA